MRRPESARPKPARVLWDEPNLEANEKIKEQFVNVKIDEPKTPYRGPLADGDMDADDDPLAPLSLEPESSGHFGGVDGGGPTRSGGSASSMGTGSAHHTDGTGGAAPAGAAGPSHSVDGSMDVDDDGRAAGGAAAGGTRRSEWSTDGSTLGMEQNSTDDDSLSSPSAEKLAAFAQNRKAHYNMADALRQARSMIGPDEEEEDEEAGAAQAAPKADAGAGATA